MKETKASTTQQQQQKKETTIQSIPRRSIPGGGCETSSCTGAAPWFKPPAPVDSSAGNADMSNVSARAIALPPPPPPPPPPLAPTLPPVGGAYATAIDETVIYLFICLFVYLFIVLFFFSQLFGRLSIERMSCCCWWYCDCCCCCCCCCK